MLLSALWPGVGRAAQPFAYARRTVAGVELHVIDADLNDRRLVVSPAIAAEGIGRSEPFSSFVRRLRPAAAINGTFFDKKSLRPIADILIDAKLANFGGIGTAVAFSEDGVDFVRVPKSRHVDWSGYGAAIGGGPLLVWEGFAKPLPGGEGFGDPSVFARAAPRTAIGVTGENHLLLVATTRGASLSRLAVAMRELGALYAFNLDGGSSVAMWFRRQMIARPSRPLTNVLCVYLAKEPTTGARLRPPGGLDWRGGHQPRPVLHFAAGELCVSVQLPRRWEGRQSVLVTSDKPLPDEWVVSIRLDDRPTPAAVAGELPAELYLDFSAFEGHKHRLWVEVVDEQGKAMGRVERIFKSGTPGHHAW